ncbi:MAG: hypothetical protein AABY95_05005 [Pseudomonadota bacterium]
MLGLWAAHAQTYLLVVVAVTTWTFALPIFLMPLRWARWFGWKIPENTDLAVYFGRCLGAFAVILELLMLRASLTGEGLLFTFQVILAVSVLLTVVHIWGAVQKIQPLLETLEIGMYAGLAVLTLLFWPVTVSLG